MNLVDYLSNSFNGAEIHLIGEEVGVRMHQRWGHRQLIEEVLAVLKKGAPLPDCSKLLEDFLYLAHVVDEAGNLQEDVITVIDPEALRKSTEICYGFPSDLDSKCSSCLLYNSCAGDLTLNLPDCYGISFGQSEDCSDCLVKDNCSNTKDYQPGNRGAKYELFFFREVPVLTNLLNSLAFFKKLFRGWPENVIVNKPNRLENISVRGAEVKNQINVFRDTIGLSIEKVIPVTDDVPKPVIFEGERRPLIDLDNTVFRKRRYLDTEENIV